MSMSRADYSEFASVLRDVARTSRGAPVVDEALSLSYFNALQDLPWPRVRAQLLKLQRLRHLFPTVAQIRDEKRELGPEARSPDWWTAVHNVEQQIARAWQPKPSGDQDLDRAVREQSKAARYAALNSDASEDIKAAAERRYARASLLADRARFLHNARELEAKPLPEDTPQNIKDARVAWIEEMQRHVARIDAHLAKFHSTDEDPWNT